MAYPNKTPPAGFRLAPSLAETWPIVSAEGKTYTFTIRKDARFSTGAPVTARAFTHALERILTPAMNSGSANGSLLDIVGAHKMLAGKATTLPGAVAKGRSLTLRLTRRVPDLLDRLAGVCAVPPTLSV
ncbi:MAG: ABC transporter substrate-binding protein, partial [Gaiellales bacterium]